MSALRNGGRSELVRGPELNPSMGKKVQGQSELSQQITGQTNSQTMSLLWCDVPMDRQRVAASLEGGIKYTSP